ncbi:MAG: DUF4160 domain-containing protein [bacterium]|nr:DUF4160 domain-containing protein [bacterium]
MRRDRSEAKFWLGPVRLAWNRGFAQNELNRVERLAIEHEHAFIREWNDYFNP